MVIEAEIIAPYRMLDLESAILLPVFLIYSIFYESGDSDIFHAKDFLFHFVEYFRLSEKYKPDQEWIPALDRRGPATSGDYLELAGRPHSPVLSSLSKLRKTPRSRSNGVTFS